MRTPQTYGEPLGVPPELSSVLKDFTREILREQPEDEHFFQFATEYFDRVVAQEQQAAKTPRMSIEELQHLLGQMFREADVDGSGALSRREFRDVLSMSELNLSEREIVALIAEADLDGNGEIGYDEFVPLAVDLVHSMYARMDAQAAMAAESEQAAEMALDFVHGMNREDVEAMMTDVFRNADADSSGALSLDEFRQACFDADIGLTRKEVNILMHQCDVDGDGTISYEEFVPVCFEMLVEVAKNNILEARRTDHEIEMLLLDVWGKADGLREGVLAPSKMSKALQTGRELPLTRLQIHSIMGEVLPEHKDARGFIDYARFAPLASRVVEMMVDRTAMAERASALAALGGVDVIKEGLSSEDVYQILSNEFKNYDLAGVGCISVDDAFVGLVNSELMLTDSELNVLASMIEFTDDDQVVYAPLCENAFDALKFCAEQAAVGSYRG